MRSSHRRQAPRTESGCAGDYSDHGCSDRAQGSPAKRVDLSSSWHWRPFAGHCGRGALLWSLPCDGKHTVQRTGLHRILSESLQSCANRFFGRRTDCHRVVSLVLAGGCCCDWMPDGISVQHYTSHHYGDVDTPPVLPVSCEVSGGSPLL